MSPAALLVYVRRALLFAGVVSAAYAGVRLLLLRLRKEKWTRQELLRLLLVFYLAALLQITVIRGGPDWEALQSGQAWRQVIWMPLQSAWELYQDGLWYVCVEVLGNVGGFLPLGFLLPVCFPRFARARWSVAASAGCSLFIEAAQFLLATGVTDIDDLLFNTLGGICGYLLWRLLRRRKRGTSPT